MPRYPVTTLYPVTPLPRTLVAFLVDPLKGRAGLRALAGLGPLLEGGVVLALVCKEAAAVGRPHPVGAGLVGALLAIYESLWNGAVMATWPPLNGVGVVDTSHCPLAVDDKGCI